MSFVHIQLCNHHHSQDRTISNTSQKLAPPTLQSCPQHHPFSGHCKFRMLCKWNPSVCVFSACLPLPGTMSLRFTMFPGVSVRSFSLLSSLRSCGCSATQPWLLGWSSFGLFSLGMVWALLLWTFAFTVCVDVCFYCSGYIRLSEPTVHLGSMSVARLRPFPTAALPCCIPTSNTGEFQPPHMLVFTYSFSGCSHSTVKSLLL